MYCILVTGIPAAGKSTIANSLAEMLDVPVISKDSIKEILFDGLGFQSRAEKVRQGVAAMMAMYYFAEQLMKRNRPFILENNFENSSRAELIRLLNSYGYQAVTVTLTGDYEVIYQRYVDRNNSPDRHRGHVVNDCFPEKAPGKYVPPIPYEWYIAGIRDRGMDSFTADGPKSIVNTTDFEQVDLAALCDQIRQAINCITESACPVD